MVDYSTTWVGQSCSQCGRIVKSWNEVGALILCAFCYAKYLASMRGK